LLNYLGRIFSHNNEDISVSPWYEKGISYYKDGNYEESLKLFDKCLSANPDNGEIYFYHGFSYYKLGEYEKGIASFCKALEYGDFRIRWNMAEELEKIGDERLLKIFLYMSNDKEVSIQLKAIEFIKKIDKPSEESFKLFDEFLSFNPDRAEIWYYQGLCCYNSGQYEKGIMSFYKALDHGDINVRRKLADELGERGDERLLEIFLHLLHDKDFSVQLKAIDAIEKTGKISDEYLTHLLTIDNPFIQIKFKTVMEKIGIEIVEPLIEYINDKNSEGRVKALKILRLTRDKRIVEPLLRLLNDEDRDFQMEVVEFLAELRDERVVEPLIKLLNDNDLSVRYKAIDVIVNIRDKRVIEPLIQILNDKDLSIKYKAIDALGKTGDKKSVEPLIQMLAHENLQVRLNSVIALGHIGDERAAETLIYMINDTECDEIQKEAIIALGKIKSELAVEPLVQIMKIKKFRDDSLEALAEIGSKRAIDVINEELRKDGFLINSKAAMVLKHKVWGKNKQDEIKTELPE
jgi:HEAT repeat protein